MKMEVVQGTKMVLYIETDKRAIEKEFRLQIGGLVSLFFLTQDRRGECRFDCG
jgi:hypothetical protein